MDEEIRYEHSSDCQDYEDYCQGGYHPVYLGEKINGRYTVIQKLGWGHFSTVWLVETDEPREQYALKIQRSKESHAETAIDEIELLKELRKHEQDKTWMQLVDDGFHIKKLQELYSVGELHRIFRPLLLVDTFSIFGVHGKHYCSVFELMGPNLLDVIQHYEYKDLQMPLQLVKKITRDVLIGLVYMHEFTGMIHTDLKPENVLIKLSPQEQKQFVEGLRNYKVRPVSMKFLYNTQSKNPSKNKKKYDKKKLKKKEAKQAQKPGHKEQSEETPGQEEIQVETPSESQKAESPSPAMNSAPETVNTTEKLQAESPPPVSAAPAEKKKKKRTKKKKQEAENGEKEQQTKPSEKQPSKKKKGPQKKVAGKKPTPINDEDSENSDNSHSEGDDQYSDEEDSKSEMKQEYTQEQLDNLKWKGININLKKDIHFKICDFGNACMHSNHFTEDIQTREYRSPEVIIGHEYLPNTDIWSLGCMVYELLTNSFLFKPKDKKGVGKDEDHLFMMIELLGPFPKAFALEGKHSKSYFNKKGDLIHGMPKSGLCISQLLNEDYDYPLEEAIAIESFLQPMLQYDPKKRISALECLQSEWLWE